MAGYDLICCVVNMGDGSKVVKHAKKYGVKGATVLVGMGTVHSRLLDFLWINEVRKEVVTMIVESDLASDAIKGIGEDMQFNKPNHGIAFSYPVYEFVGSRNSTRKTVQENLSNNGVKNNMYKVIFVIVDKGKGEDVVDAANKAGARGGTIINARGAGIHEVQKLFSVEIEPEKEEIFIITKTETKDSIVESIRTHMKIDVPGNGVMFVVDINEAYGLR